jgi:N-acetylmuramoyl-L-alanine amidase
MLGRATGLLKSRFVRGAVALAAVAIATVAFSTQGQAGSGVLKVRLGGDQGATRVVLELDQAAAGKLISDGADGSRKVVVAFPRMDVAGDVEGRGEGLVQSWSLDEAAGGARLRLNLSRDAKVERRFLLPPAEGVAVYRYVVDLKAKAPVAAAAKGPARITTVRVEAPRRASKPVIVIDAGHGGKDPGASGSSKTRRESAVTLAAAKALKTRLEKTGRFKVVLTRDADVFVPLQTRVQIARRADADLFISLHADAGDDPTLRGASVYTLSEKGSERVAQRVMRREGFIDVNLPASDRSVNQILLDLTQRSTRNRSAAFAELLLDRIGEHTTLLRRSHRDAGFVVLLAPDVPAVLLEMGFMTNLDDERLLADPARRARLMDGAAEAVVAWFDGETAPATRTLAAAG